MFFTLLLFLYVFEIMVKSNPQIKMLKSPEPGIQLAFNKWSFSSLTSNTHSLG